MTDTPPATGRTPWDFLSELLRLLYRIGPTAVVVAGFLLFALLFYQELNQARAQADEQLQRRLSTAQEQLIQTYEKIGSMSEQMIGNIGSLIDLNNTIDGEIEDSREHLRALETEAKADLEAARKEAQEARRDAEAAKAEAKAATTTADEAKEKVEIAKSEMEKAKREAERAGSEATKARTDVRQAKKEVESAITKAESARKEMKELQEAAKLAEQEAERARNQATAATDARRDAEERLLALDTTRRELEVHIAELTREKEVREKEIAHRARHIASQQDMIQDLQDELSANGPVSMDSQQSSEDLLMVSLLEQFAKSPLEPIEELERALIGVDLSTLDRVIGQAEGFESWVSDDSGNYYGFVGSTEYGYDSFLQVLSFGEDSVAMVRSFRGIHALKVPRSDDWYSYWMVWTVVMKDHLLTKYDSGDYNRWDIYTALDKWDMEVNLEEGKSRTFDVIPIAKLEELHPSTFETWAKGVDQFGRPSLILRMLDRSVNYDENSPSWIDVRELPVDLASTFKEILVACVARQTGDVRPHLGPDIHSRELGTLAAMALRDEPEIVDVTKSDVANGNAPVVQSVRVTVSVVGLEASEDGDSAEDLGDRYDIGFTRLAEDDPWRLVNVARRSI